MTLMAIVWLSSKTYSVQSLSRRSGMIAASIFLLAPIMHSIHWFEYLPKLFAGFLSPERGSLFLLLPISGFMFLGVAFGSYLHGISEEQRNIFMKKTIFLVGISAIVIGIYQSTFHFARILEYLNPGSMIMRTGIIILFIGLCSYL